MAPTFQEISDHLGIASKSSVHRLITALEERGHIERIPGRVRAIKLK
jgi:repressor LexA